MSFKHFLTVALLSLSSVIVMAQNKRITGTVVDTNGDPVIGAGVTHVGTTNGVVTDGKGNYVFSVPDGATINVEALGFEPQQFTVASGRNVYDVTLVESATELDETVVVGYGTQRKRLITGSTVNVSGDKLAAVNAVDAFGALQSQAAGVTIVQNSGQPGESYKMTIRGMGTAGSTTPLYVVDGVPGGSIEALSPNDIESIDVLKDAASSAIYGARAANALSGSAASSSAKVLPPRTTRSTPFSRASARNRARPTGCAPKASTALTAASLSPETFTVEPVMRRLRCVP